MCEIDVEKLRDDLKQDCYAAFFVAGYGGALVESLDIDKASPEILIELAKDKKVDFHKYIINDL